MALSAKLVATIMIASGLALAAAGAASWLWGLPQALMAGGLVLVGFGLTAVDVGGGSR